MYIFCNSYEVFLGFYVFSFLLFSAGRLMSPPLFVRLNLVVIVRKGYAVRRRHRCGARLRFERAPQQHVRA